MGFFSRFENKMEDTVEGAASRMSKAPISPVQIAKRAERQMRRETMVGAGKEYAPTLYTVLVNPEDDSRLFGYYPTLAGETETYLKAQAQQAGLVMDGDPLVRFIVDESLRHGRFEVIAETVSAPIVAQLRDEEMEHYGLAPQPRHGTPSHPIPQPHGAAVAAGAVAAGAAAGAVAGSRSRSGRHSRDFDIPAGEPRQQAPKTMAYAGSPAPADGQGVRARLIDLSQNRTYDLTGTSLVMGRDSSCDITVQDINASRNHAEISQNPQGMWVVTDLNSTNGTLVNNVAIASQPLYVGDVITIGKTDFEFALA